MFPQEKQEFPSFVPFLTASISICVNSLPACPEVEGVRDSLLEGKKIPLTSYSYCSVAQSVRLCVTPRTVARQACLSITVSRSLLRLTSIESVMPSNHLILCRPLLRLPSIFPSSRVFSSESALCIIYH